MPQPGPGALAPLLKLKPSIEASALKVDLRPPAGSIRAFAVHRCNATATPTQLVFLPSENKQQRKTPVSLILQVHLFSSRLLSCSFSRSELRPGSGTRVIICLQLVLCESWSRRRRRRRSPITVSGARHKLKRNPILLRLHLLLFSFFSSFFCFFFPAPLTQSARPAGT